jgi:DNA polymerase-3 subunit beta
MKFVINRNDLLEPLSQLQGLTGRKTSLAITTTVLIRADENGIRLSATDLETGFEGFYPAQVESGGVVAINARKLFEIVRDFPSQGVQVEEAEHHWVEIGNDTVLYHIVGLNPDDFPDIPRLEDVEMFVMEAGMLKKMIERTVFISGASDDKRPHILGNYLEIIDAQDETVLRMVSTDGGRLAKMDYRFGGRIEPPFEGGLLIPKKGLYETTKFLKNEGDVQLGIKNNHVIVKKEKETLIIRLLEGEFPEYADIIVKDKDNDILMDRQPFLMMLRRMSILSSDNYRAVMFHFQEGKLTIESTNPEIGESKESMAVDFKREGIHLAFNPRFFTESLNVLEEEKVRVNIGDEKKPCIIEGESADGYISAIMPMRV